MNGISGQAYLPLDDEHAAAAPVKLSVQHEAFCLEYVKTGNATRSYAKVRPRANLRTAQAESSRLLSKHMVKQRVAELRQEIEAECKALVIDFHKAAVTFDPAVCFTAQGERKELHDIDAEQRKVMGLDARIVDGTLRYIPTFPTTTDKHRSADSLAKIMAMNKEQVTIDVGNESTSTIELAAKLFREFAARTTGTTGEGITEGMGTVTGTPDSSV
jgi:hypothetical protein